MNEIDTIINKSKNAVKKLNKKLAKKTLADFHGHKARWIAHETERVELVKRLGTVMALMMRMHRMASSEYNKLGYQQISMRRIKCILADGAKLVDVTKKMENGETYIDQEWHPKSRAFDEIAVIIVSMWFTRLTRGNQRQGFSRWAPRQTPVINNAVLLSLNAIHDANKDDFDRLTKFLLTKETETEAQNINFDVASSVDFTALGELLENLMVDADVEQLVRDSNEYAQVEEPETIWKGNTNEYW